MRSNVRHAADYMSAPRKRGKGHLEKRIQPYRQAKRRCGEVVLYVRSPELCGTLAQKWNAIFQCRTRHPRSEAICDAISGAICDDILLMIMEYAVEEVVMVFGGYDGHEAIKDGEVVRMHIEYPLPPPRLLPSLCVARYRCAAATLHDTVYVLGGFDDNKEDASSLVDAFDTSNNEMRSVTPMSQARDVLAAVAFQGAVYALGGYANEGSAERFIPSRNEWEDIAPMRSAHALGARAVICDGAIHVWGDHLERYNTESNTWDVVAPFGSISSLDFVAASPDSAEILVAADGQAQAVNVRDGSTRPLRCLRQQKWAGDAAFACGKWLLVGGQTHGPATARADVQAYNNKENKWQRLPNLARARAGPAAAVVTLT